MRVWFPVTLTVKLWRTVKTCVGSEWCRFGTQDSTGLGIRIEKFMWSCWTPAKVKMAVSGCPRNCAEATCKDVGVVCVDSGYEIHIGGGSGLTVRQTELLCKVATEDEVMEFVAGRGSTVSPARSLLGTHVQVACSSRHRVNQGGDC